MAGTFSKIYIQVVFAVQNRRCIICSTWEDELYMYISGIIKKKGQKPLAINGMPDHIHIFLALKPSCCLSDLVREIKKSTNEFIENKSKGLKFHWQEGYGAFSYSPSHADRVIRYILNQKEHHKKQAFREEYTGILEQFDIEFKKEYLFNWIE